MPTIWVVGRFVSKLLSVHTDRHIHRTDCCTEPTKYVVHENFVRIIRSVARSLDICFSLEIGSNDVELLSRVVTVGAATCGNDKLATPTAPVYISSECKQHEHKKNNNNRSSPK